ncbi:MAG TPA: FmdB family zinc ribbon protein [Acidimicrobiales bacterium]
MPTYEYECQQCHERIEAVQKFTDAPLSTCPLCGGALRKVFSAVGIVFKGSGFYKNDSRGSSPKSTTAGAATTESPSTSDSASSATPTPAPSTTATSTPASTSPSE